MNDLYNVVCFHASKKTTTAYSTSFSSGILLFDKHIRQDIYNIYGFVRFADEIVDTYNGPEKEELFKEFRKDTFLAIKRGVSFNPIIHSFQFTVNKHLIDHQLIHAFLDSMAMDLNQTTYNEQQLDQYVYGSAEVIGLMCLAVFTANPKDFQNLQNYARALGSAFQKVNFLRDLTSDYQERGRVYFPGVTFKHFTQDAKYKIEKEIRFEMNQALIGIEQLPKNARFGVLLAFNYYNKLLDKICETSPEKLKKERIRIPNWKKLILFTKVLLRSSYPT